MRTRGWVWLGTVTAFALLASAASAVAQTQDESRIVLDFGVGLFPLQGAVTPVLAVSGASLGNCATAGLLPLGEALSEPP